MKMSFSRTAMFAAVLSGLSLTGRIAAAENALAVPDAAVARDVPGAHELPDPNRTYKVVFDVGIAADKIDEVNPMLATVARYVNTLAKYGVPQDHRKIAVVFHQKGTEIIQNNGAYKARNGGHDNPNVALIRELKKAGVDFRVCGQAVLGAKIDPKNIQPEIQLDLWALTTLVDFQLDGYVHVGR